MANPRNALSSRVPRLPCLPIRVEATGRGVQLFSHSPAQTRRFGERLGRLLQGGEVFAVCGDLGAGKTCFIQGLARGLGVRDSYLSSPTFIFIQKYAGRLALYHVDLYRIDHASDAEGLGLLDCFDQKSIVAIEWAERAQAFLPPLRITVEIKNGGGSKRRLLFHVPAEFEYLIKK
jgi:tRNA threonylcarbamoyladenosine biosynthesis protein TsaE